MRAKWGVPLQCSVHQCQVDVIKAMLSDMDPDVEKLPKGSNDLGDGYALLRARDERSCEIPDAEGAAVQSFCEQRGYHFTPGWKPRVQHWARLKVPTGQIAHSVWKEKQKLPEEVWMSQNVKVCSTYSLQLLSDPSTTAAPQRLFTVRGGAVLLHSLSQRQAQPRTFPSRCNAIHLFPTRRSPPQHLFWHALGLQVPSRSESPSGQRQGYCVGCWYASPPTPPHSRNSLRC
jgi:hypothetical protein